MYIMDGRKIGQCSLRRFGKIRANEIYRLAQMTLFMLFPVYKYDIIVVWNITNIINSKDIEQQF